MTWDTIKLPLYNILTAILTAAGMYWGVPAIAPQKAPQPQALAPLPATVICDVAALVPTLRTLEGQQGLILGEMRDWVTAERKRQAAEAAAWAAARAKAASR